VSETPREGQSVILRAILSGAREGDRFGASVNGSALEAHEADFAWKDAQLFAPGPQPASGGNGHYEIDPDQRLLRLEFSVPPTICRAGVNDVGLWIDSRIPYCCDRIVLEKVEVHLGKA